MVKFPATVWVHPASVQIGAVMVGEYSSLWPGSVIRADFDAITIGRFTSVQDCCVLHAAPAAPVAVGDFVTLGHGVKLHACTVEDACLIGINAVVMDRAVIGRGSIVAPGAVVRENTRVPPGSLVMGVPAQVRNGKPGQEQAIIAGALSYCALAQVYMAGQETISPDELMKKMEEMKKLAGP